MINFTSDNFTFITPTPIPYSHGWFNLYPSIGAIFTAIGIIIGIFVLGKFFWMLVYEIRFGLGDEYISGKLTREEKAWIKEKYPLFRRFKEWLQKQN